MQKLYGHRYLLILFILNFIEMGIELSAAKLLSPYFGNSPYVWVSILSVIIIGGALGNYIGGKVKQENYPSHIVLMFSLTTIWIAFIYKFGDWASTICTLLHIIPGTLISSILMFLPPCLFLSTMTPIILTLYCDTNQSERQGISHSVIAIGGLLGTVITGFIILPFLGTDKTFLVFIIILVLSAIFLLYKYKKIKKLVEIVTLLVCSILLCIVPISQYESDVVADITTNYSRIKIIKSQIKYEGEDKDILLYQSAGASSSATFIDEDLKYELVFDYLKTYDEINNKVNANSVAMIGGAAYMYPKYYISHYTDKTMDVIEIDEQSPIIAKKYFYLDDLLKEYGTDRLNLITDDGRLYFQNSSKLYDIIFNDAFSGGIPVSTLCTDEAVKIIKNKLTNTGCYALNILGSLQGPKGRFLRSEIKVLQNNFNYVTIVPTNKNDLIEYSNYIVIASDMDYNIDGVNVEFEENEIFLTDNNCPVDMLVSTHYME